MIFGNGEIAIASIEILTMLLGSFALGIMFHWSLIPREQDIVTPIEEKGIKEDDLQLIEGIGPVLEKYLHKQGIFLYKDIFTLDIEYLEEMLKAGGSKYSSANVTTWPDQAELAHNKKWSELEEYQEILGKKKKKRK